MPCSRSIPPLLYGEDVRPAYDPSALPLAKRRTNAFTHQHGCILNPDTAQANKLLDHLTSVVGRFRSHHRIALTLQLGDLREHQFQSSKQTRDLGMRIRR